MKYFVLFLFLFSVQLSYAQEQRFLLDKADSIFFDQKNYGLETDTSEALALYSSALSKAYNAENWAYYFEVEGRYIEVLVGTGMNAKAIHRAGLMFERAKSIGFEKNAAFAPAYAALFYRGLQEGGLNKAVTYLDSSLAIITASNQKFQEFFYSTYLLKAIVSNSFQKYQEAEYYLGSAYKSDPDKKKFYTLIGRYIKISWQVQKFDQALNLAEEYIEIMSRKVGTNSTFYALAQKNKGAVYFQMNDYLKAIPYYQKALDYFSKNKDENLKRYTEALIDLGTCFIWTGYYEDAEKTLLDGYEIAQNNIENADVFIQHSKVALNNLVVLYNLQEKYEQAKESQKIVLSMQENNPDPLQIAEYHDTMGLVFHNLNEMDSAVFYYNKALEMWKERVGTDHFQYLQTVNKISRTYQRMGEFEKASELSQQVRSVLEKSQGDNYRVFLAFYNPLAMSYYQQGKVESAKMILHEDKDFYLSYIRQYFNQLSEVQRQKFYDTFSEFMDIYKTFCLLEGQNDQQLLENFLSFQEETKGILLNTSLSIRNKIENSGDQQALNLFNDINALQKEIGKYYLTEKDILKNLGVNLDSLENQLNQWEMQLASLSEVYNEENTDFSEKEVKTQLRSDEAIVDIVRTNLYDLQQLKSTDSLVYTALIVRKDRPLQLVIFEDGNRLEEKQIKGYSNAIKYRIVDANSFDAFWKPIALKLGRSKKVFLLADGIYHKINVNTLYNPANERYLFEDYQIQKLSSLSDLKQKEQSEKSVVANKNIVLFGNPDYGNMDGTNSSGVLPLAGTQKEVESIAKLINQKRDYTSDVFLGKSANEENFKNSKSPYILHIATHGFFNQNEEESQKVNPLSRSGLLLADANYFLTKTVADSLNLKLEDGVFTAYEAQALDVYGTELVVLSACETGLGELKNSQGVYGLQRSFKKAGAKNLIMSLWKVNDEVTQKMMTEFYKNWLGGKSFEKSFRNAQKVIKSEYSHPYYWGAFELI